MLNIEYVRVREDDLFDFKGLILPNIYEELTVLGDFDAANILVVGAVEHIDTAGNSVGADIPIGLAVGGWKKDRELFIYSIFVSENYQRQGIGSGLLESLIGLAAGNLTGILVRENGVVDIFVHVDYALPAAERMAFELFLKANGFTDFAEGPAIYLLDSKKMGAASTHTGTTPLSDVGDRTDLSTLFGTIGIAYDPDCSVFLGSAEEPKLIILAEVVNDGNLALSSKAFVPISEESYADVVNDAVCAVCAKYGEPILSVNTQFNEHPEFWKAQAKNAGEIYERVEAGMYAILS